jgi:hypothetical protein
MTEPTSNLQANAVHEAFLPYRMWWGLAFCAAAMGLIFAVAPYSANVEFAPKQSGGFWYLWQRVDASVVTRLSAWIPYIVHQISIWALIYYAKQQRPRYVFGLHSFNLWALVINAFFIFAHIVQTKYFYDGLAQDVHESTSMMSVIIMLLMILLMENKRRGMFFGYGIKPMYSIGDTLKRYHGYYFSWAIIYTFWYHPVEITSGHIAGFAYMFLLMLQGSLFFTRFHTNRWWTVALETLFVVHGAIVAAYIMNPGEHQYWAMFLFGGAGTFLITQIHGLGLTTKQKSVVGLVLVGATVLFYFSFPGALELAGTLPMIMYIGTGICFLLLTALRFGWQQATAGAPAQD